MNFDNQKFEQNNNLFWCFPKGLKHRFFAEKRLILAVEDDHAGTKEAAEARKKEEKTEQLVDHAAQILKYKEGTSLPLSVQDTKVLEEISNPSNLNKYQKLLDAKSLKSKEIREFLQQKSKTKLEKILRRPPNKNSLNAIINFPLPLLFEVFPRGHGRDADQRMKFFKRLELIIIGDTESSVKNIAQDAKRQLSTDFKNKLRVQTRDIVRIQPTMSAKEKEIIYRIQPALTVAVHTEKLKTSRNQEGDIVDKQDPTDAIRGQRAEFMKDSDGSVDLVKKNEDALKLIQDKLGVDTKALEDRLRKEQEQDQITALQASQEIVLFTQVELARKRQELLKNFMTNEVQAEIVTMLGHDEDDESIPHDQKEKGFIFEVLEKVYFGDDPTKAEKLRRAKIEDFQKTKNFVWAQWKMIREAEEGDNADGIPKNNFQKRKEFVASLQEREWVSSKTGENMRGWISEEQRKDAETVIGFAEKLDNEVKSLQEKARNASNDLWEVVRKGIVEDPDTGQRDFYVGKIEKQDYENLFKKFEENPNEEARESGLNPEYKTQIREKVAERSTDERELIEFFEQIDSIANKYGLSREDIVTMAQKGETIFEKLDLSGGSDRSKNFLRAAFANLINLDLKSLEIHDDEDVKKAVEKRVGHFKRKASNDIAQEDIDNGTQFLPDFFRMQKDHFARQATEDWIFPQIAQIEEAGLAMSTAPEDDKSALTTVYHEAQESQKLEKEQLPEMRREMEQQVALLQALAERSDLQNVKIPVPESTQEKILDNIPIADEETWQEHGIEPHQLQQGDMPRQHAQKLQEVQMQFQQPEQTIPPEINVVQWARQESERLQSFLDTGLPTAMEYIPSQSDLTELHTRGFADDPATRDDLHTATLIAKQERQDFDASLSQARQTTSGLQKIIKIEDTTQIAKSLGSLTRSIHIPSISHLTSSDEATASIKAAQESVKERKEIAEVEKIANLKNLLFQWRFGGADKPSNQDFINQLHQTTDAKGDKVVETLSIEKFQKKYGNDVMAHFENIGQGKYRIYIREDCQNDASKYAHELAHAMVSFGGKVEGKNVATNFLDSAEAILKTQGIDLEDEKGEYKKLSDGDFAQEVFSQLFGEATSEFRGPPGDAARKIQTALNNTPGMSLQDLINFSFGSEEDFKNNTAKKLGENFLQSWLGREGHHAEMFTGVESSEKVTDPARLKILWDQFRQREEYLQTKLDAISKSDAPDKGQFISDIEDNLQELKDLLRSDTTDRNFKLALGGRRDKDGIGVLINSANSALSRIADTEQVNQNYLRELYNDTTFLSLADIHRMWNTFKDFVVRQHERRSKGRGGKVGKAVLQGVWPKAADEFDMEAEAAEKEEVNKRQEALKNKDPWQIYDTISGITKDKDLMKACLLELAEYGQINWMDDTILDAFHRLGVPVRFRDTDKDDWGVLSAKLQRACAALWDNDFFRSANRNSDSNFETKKNEYENEAKAFTNNLNVLVPRMLKDHVEGGEVFPQRYEMFIHQALDAGKLTPEDLVFYLIQGVHSGLLPLSRLTKLDDKFINKVPIIQFLGYATRPTMADINHWASMFRPDPVTFEPPPEFRDWIDTVAYNHMNIYERVTKAAGSQGQDKWDHDFAQSIGKVGNAQSAKIICSVDDNGRPVYDPTFYGNAIDGQLEHTTHMALHQDQHSTEEFRHIMARQFGYIANFDATLYGRMRQGDPQAHRLMDMEKKEAPRMPNFTNKKLSLEEVSGRLRDIINATGDNYLQSLMGGNEQQVRQHLLTDYQYLQDLFDPQDIQNNFQNTTIDTMYQKFDVCAEKIFEQNPNALKNAMNRAEQVWHEVQRLLNNNKKVNREDRKWNWGVMSKIRSKLPGYRKYWQKNPTSMDMPDMTMAY